MSLSCDSCPVGVGTLVGRQPPTMTVCEGRERVLAYVLVAVLRGDLTSRPQASLQAGSLLGTLHHRVSFGISGKAMPIFHSLMVELPYFRGSLYFFFIIFIYF